MPSKSVLSETLMFYDVYKVWSKHGEYLNKKNLLP